jgi:hypothetical protein
MPTSRWPASKPGGAQARRDGWFPVLIDTTRSIDKRWCYDGLDHFLEPPDPNVYTLDRTGGQERQIWIGMEKAILVAQASRWFEAFGFPIIALRGYGSQSYLDHIAYDIRADGRRSVLIYAGDLDPTGEDIDRDFIAWTGCWDRVERVAVNDPDGASGHGSPNGRQLEVIAVASLILERCAGTRPNETPGG